MQRIASLLRDAAYELLQAVDRLKNTPMWPVTMPSAPKHSKTGWRMSTAKRWQNYSQARYRACVMILKLREVYRHLSNAADRGDEAANVIADIVVKIA